MASPQPVGRAGGLRKLPGTSIELSAIGWELPAGSGPVGMLASRAIDLGFRLVDVGAVGPAAVRLDRLQADRRRELTVLCELGHLPSGGGNATAPPEARRLLDRLGVAFGLLQVEEGELPGLEPSQPEAFAEWSGGGRFGWGVRLDPDEGELAPLRAAISAGACFLSVRASLLEPAGLRRAQRASAGRVGILGLDPFAQGRLDGALLRARPPAQGSPEPPVPVPKLQEEYGPMLRLAFLTGEHRRTLAQASLQALLAGTGVFGVIAPVDRAGQLEQYAQVDRLPPFSDLEWAELGRVWPVDIDRPRAGTP